MPRTKRKPSAPQPSAAQLEAREAGAARLRAATEKRKRPAPVVLRQHTETSDQKIGQDHPREMPSTGPARIEPPQIEMVDKPVTGDKLKLLAFMEEEMTILVHDSTNPTDEPIPYVLNGGQRQAFARGQEQKVKRKYVEVLARMKRQSFTQERYKDSQGIDAIRNIPHSALVFPFSVIHDPNPRGRDWLKAILAEAQ